MVESRLVRSKLLTIRSVSCFSEGSSANNCEKSNSVTIERLSCLSPERVFDARANGLRAQSSREVKPYGSQNAGPLPGKALSSNLSIDLSQASPHPKSPSDVEIITGRSMKKADGEKNVLSVENPQKDSQHLPAPALARQPHTAKSLSKMLPLGSRSLTPEHVHGHFFHTARQQEERRDRRSSGGTSAQQDESFKLNLQ